MFKKLLSSSYLRAVAVLSTGQFVSALIPMLAAPILGRLYLPEEYGFLATYMALANILSVISTFQLQHAIIAEKFDSHAYQMVRVCLWALCIVASFALFIGIGLYFIMENSAEYAQQRLWMLLLPYTVLIGGTTTTLTFLANRQKLYKKMAQAQIIMVITSVSLSISLGFLGWGANGLFTSYFTSHTVYFLYFLRLLKSMRPENTVLASPVKSWALLKRHRKFAMFTMPSGLLNTVNMQMPILILSAFGTASLIGSFSRARQLVGAPLTLLGNSIAQVFRQRGSELYNSTGSCRPLYLRTFLMLFGVGMIPTAILILFGPALFMLILGPNWGEAGEIARILAPMFLLRLAVAPLTQVFMFTKAQNLDFLLSIVSLGLVLLGVFIPIVLKLSPLSMIIGYAIAYSIIYIIYGIFSWKRTVK